MEEHAKRPLIVLTGPTAAGKTKLSISLAKAVGGEVISADSMQVYRGMDIGSAKITREEMDGVPHYLVDEQDPGEDFSVVHFACRAKRAMETIYSHGHIPILVGGTGFYIQAVAREIEFSEDDVSLQYRKKLEQTAKDEGSHTLHEMLRAVDPKSADLIHENNVKRVIRALEYFHENQSPISLHNEEQRKKESPYNLAYFVLTMPREECYRRIDSRVDQMMEEGLLQEVERLKEMGCHRGMVSMQGLGYKELLDYLEGEISLEEAVRRIKRDTRHFAKRQLTWFRRETDVIWMDKKEYDYDERRILMAMLSILREKGIISG